MTEETNSDLRRRRFTRLDLKEDVRALDEKGRDIGQVEKVGAGGMQIRLAEDIPDTQYHPGVQFRVDVVEPGNVRNQFKVEVRVREGKLLGVQFLN